ncbi:SGNH/GDSL hydrolase family protein [Acinetobacter guillouiae]|uniref:SGNH/GDSL hydrolase family protein n=1 Tax=Acinetobacter guillouiae TaxID=106649 RepID=UPI0028E2C20D|nr:SGNH/GDSL hydrolase family protein [Acinetobacter guillouiae]
MADQIITKQKLVDANKNADAWEKYWSGNEDENVLTHLNKIYPTHAKALKNLMENGGLQPFETEVQLLATVPEVSPTAAKALDTKKVWIWKQTSVEGIEPKVFEWIDTGLSELDQAKKYILGTDVDQIMPQSILGAYAGNINLKSVEILGNHVNFTTGYYIGVNGILFPFPATKVSDYIPVKLGESFTITPSLTFVGAVYDKYLNFIDVLSGLEGANETFTINQSDAAFIRFNVSIPESTKVYMNTQQTILPWLENTPDSIVDALPILLDPKNAGNLLADVTYVNGGYINDKNEIVNWPVYKYTNEFIEIHPSTRYIISFAAIYVGVYFDENKTFIGAIKSSSGIGTNNYEFSTPPNAKYLKVNISNSDSVQSLTLKNAGLSLVNKSAWLNKKIAWYGTSIPAGYPHSYTEADRDIYSHANLAVHDLGGIIINKCVPAGGIGLGVVLSFSRLTDSINYQNSLLNLIGTEREPDLVVFDYGVNDYDQHPIDMDAFNPNDPFNAAMSIDSRDANTFIGAHNKIIDEMLSLKPDMKFCFITHFSNDNANPNIAKKQDFFKQMNIVIKALADYWSAPILNLHEKTGYRNRSNFDSITPVMPDHIHPASGDGRSVESLRNIMRQFLVSIA